MTTPARALPPAFYAAPAGNRHAWADWWVLLHPPYTMWHLSYVAVGACIAPRFDGGRLVATMLAFFLAVGICAHALDELHGRPLRTAIPSWALVTAATVSLSGAVALGIAGIGRVGPGLGLFVVVGAVLTCGYNLELLGGRLHNDVTFAAAWGAFPVLTAYYAQAETLGLPAVAAAIGAYSLSNAQRALSTPARTLRRRVTSVEGHMTFADGRTAPLTATALLAPLETALRATAWAIVGLAAALVLDRALRA
jgi:phosphotransferase system  glucose/maltose/N-acetylglucosamine-specific IIC component